VHVRGLAAAAVALSFLATGCQSARAAADKALPPPRPCDLAAQYQCQPVNNDAALQRLVDDLGADPAQPVTAQRVKLGTELCAISLVLTGVEVTPTDDPLTQRIRRIEDLGAQGKGPAIDPATVACPVAVRGAPEVPAAKPVIGCSFTDGSQCQPVNNDAALRAVTVRLDGAATASDKLAVLIEEGCAIDRVAAGVYNPPPDAPLTTRWNNLAARYSSIAEQRGDLATAQEPECPALHQQVTSK
jgi:hypothetical protein